MSRNNNPVSDTEIIVKAKQFGAYLAGIAGVEALKKSPSHVIYGKLGVFEGIRPKDPDKVKATEVVWPAGARSAVVIAVEHPEDRPDLDWWQAGLKGGTPGNQILMDVSSRLTRWLQEKAGIKAWGLPYHVENGGIFLKDAAVLAGLGCIGKNNMLITPLFGPKVRLRTMLLDIDLPATGPIDYNPCMGCPMPCMKACPRNAFQCKIYSKEKLGLDHLPGRTGTYSRDLCNKQMKADLSGSESVAESDLDQTDRRIKYCRRCELECPVGRD